MAISKQHATKIVRALTFYMEQNGERSILTPYRIKEDLDMRVTAVNKDIELSKTAVALQHKMDESKLSTDFIVLGSEGSQENYLYTPNIARIKLNTSRFTFAESDEIVFPYHIQVEFLDKDKSFCCGAGELIDTLHSVSRNNPKYRKAVHLYGLDFINEASNNLAYQMWLEMMRRIGIIDHVMTPAEGMYPIGAQGDYIYFRADEGYESFNRSFSKSHYTRYFRLDGFGTLLTAKHGQMVSLEGKNMNCEALGFTKICYRQDLFQNNMWSII